MKPVAMPKKPKSKSDSLFNALRNAKELALEVGSSASMGWPLWWLQDVVLEYCARPDGVSISDALMNTSVPAFRYVQHSRTLCIQRLHASFDEYSHFGLHLPTPAECIAHKIPPVLEFVWPNVVGYVFKHLGRVAAVCSTNGVLWIADTGCGYHLVPEGDIARGKAVIVPNPGAQRLHTANGEIDASECVKFSLSEIGLSKQLATILPETPRVLSVGALCMDERATFFWPAGGTPYFTLLDGRVVHCEVHGRVPYLRTGSFASQASSYGNAALPLVETSTFAASPVVLQALPSTAPPLSSLSVVYPSDFQVLPSALPAPPGVVGALPPVHPVAELPALPPLPRLNAALRAELDEVEDGHDGESDPPVVDPPPAVLEEARPSDVPVIVLAKNVAAEAPEDEHLVRARKAEATSLRHLLTHHPKNIYCVTCCTAKCQTAPHRRKQHKFWGGKPEPEEFGDQFTADHIVAYSERSMGVTGHQAAVVFGDRATGYFEGFPLIGKTTPDTSHALRCFAGSNTLKRVWTDNSPELIATMIEAKVVHDLSTQGQPQSNGRAERLVRRTMDGTKTLLLQAGLPGAFWPYAMKAYCFAQNTEMIDGDSAWHKRHKQGHFDGPKIPFGALIDFKPQKDDAKKITKGSPDTVPGVFLGYKIQPGGLWQGEYRVAALTEFVSLDLVAFGRHDDIHHQVVKEIVWFPKMVVVFPLRAKYDYCTRSLAGAEGVPYDASPDTEPEFSELGYRDPAPPAPIPVIPDPLAPPLAPMDPTDHGRVIRGTEVIVGGLRYRELSDGRRYLLDESGSIRKKNTLRPPYISDTEWRAFGKDFQAQMTAEWKADAVSARARAIGGVPSVPPVVPPAALPPGEVPVSGASSSSSGPAAPALCAVPAMCAATLGRARKKYAIQMMLPPVSDAEGSDSDDEPANFVAPAMPVIMRAPGYKPKHRAKIPDHELPFPACVARPVNKTEVALNKAAQAAMDLEWSKLRDKQHPELKTKGCWDVSQVEELHAVKARGQRLGVTYHFGRVFGICVEKGSELPLGDPGRKFKGRYVFQGSEVKDQNWEAAIFQELGSSPAAMEAGNSCDFYGLLPGNRSEQSDAEQAYTQSLLRGVLTWVILPRDRWPPEWAALGLKNPVVPLRLALYGHPDAGGYWEQHCESHLESVGFVPISEWRSCFWHAALRLFLVVYVDDFKLSGPDANLAKGWDLIQKGIATDKPHKPDIFLGCKHEESVQTSPWTGKQVRVLTYNMESFLADAVAKYSVLSGGLALRRVNTPFLEDAEPPLTANTEAVKPGGGSAMASEALPEGELKHCCASVLMKLLYAARMCRYDLLHAIGRLACLITRWDSHCDRMLHRLMCYVNSTLHVRKVAWVGEGAATIGVHLYADADFAGCKRTGRSTSGAFLCMGGNDTFFPLQAVSRKQSAVSHSTPEAEIVAADTALRMIGVPSLPLWDTILEREALCVFHEDNAAMIQVCRTGKNPTMRYMGRTHRVSVHWLHEVFKERWLDLVKTGTHFMRADIFTKGFETLDKWTHALHLINHVDPAKFFNLNPGAEVITFAPEPASETGGVVAVPAVAGTAHRLNLLPIPRRALHKFHRMVSVAKWPRGGAFNDSSSLLLGADFDCTGPRVALLTSDYGDLVREINLIISSSIPDVSFAWSSLLIEVNTVCDSRSAGFADGPALTFVHGKHSGPACVSGTPLSPDTLCFTLPRRALHCLRIQDFELLSQRSGTQQPIGSLSRIGRRFAHKVFPCHALPHLLLSLAGHMFRHTSGLLSRGVLCLPLLLCHAAGSSTQTLSDIV